MGEIAARSLLEQIEKRSDYVPEIAIEPEFVVRESTANGLTSPAGKTKRRYGNFSSLASLTASLCLLKRSPIDEIILFPWIHFLIPLRASRIVTALLHLGFVLTGIFMVLLGPVLPALVQRWGLNDSQAGLFFAAQFLGSVLSNFLSGLLIPEFGFRPAFVGGSR